MPNKKSTPANSVTFYIGEQKHKYQVGQEVQVNGKMRVPTKITEANEGGTVAVIIDFEDGSYISISNFAWGIFYTNEDIESAAKDPVQREGEQNE